MESSPAHFWQAEGPAQPVARRILWQFHEQRGELTIVINPGQPILPITNLSEKAAEAVTVGPAVRPDQPIAPGFVFASIANSPSTGTAVVTGPAGREIPIVTPPDPAPEQAHTMRARMDRTGNAIPPARVKSGDHAVGLLVRKDILFFYPLVTIGTDAEIESYQGGAGTTTDLIHVLPFQS